MAWQSLRYKMCEIWFSELAQGQWSQIAISWLQIRSRIYCRKYADLGQYRMKLSTNKLTHAFDKILINLLIIII
jgi:hypothetical protein